MSSLQTVQTKRSYLVSTLAGESVEKYERLLDHLLSQNVLNWEDYEALSLVGQPLSTLVRCLLDTITRKGEVICKHFLDALHKVEDSTHEDHLCLQLSEDFSQPSQYLQRERPRIVHLIHKYINTILQQLVEHRYIQQIETDHVQLPIFSTPQKARRLLDLLRVKGDEPARFLIEFIHNVGQGLIAQVTDVCLAYQTKLKTTISAQSKFLSTYDGSENMRLEDIYTESILEIPKNSNNSEHMQGSQNQDLLSIFNAQGVLNDNADTILILGDAGSGKSTLLQQIQHLWADGQAFQNFCFIFPFSCRRLHCITKPISLRTLLYEQCCWPSDQLQDEIFQFILDNPRQVLITFDGFDELRFAFTDDTKHCSPTETTNISSLVFNLLQGNLMKDCIKLVTSRPDAVNVNLRKYVRKELHLKGFSEEGIEFFMTKHHSTPDTARDIINVVKANSSLHGLCNIPVFCWIVSKCHKQLVGCGSNTPQTMTDMYFLTLKHFLLHSSTKLKDMTLSEKAVQGLDIDHLKMTYCGIGPAECTALAYVLKHLKKPVGIQLDHNSVGDIGIGQLIPCLHKCHSLYLRDNNISDKGLCRLMEQILHWPSFQKIALFNNRLTDECMNSIACVLKHKQNFLSLRLGNNFITSIGGQILAEGLSENNSIKYLGLWGNQVGDTGAKAISDVLKDNRTLIWLSLVGNNIGSVGGEALAGMLERNTILEELWLDENRLQDSDAIFIAESLKKNQALKVLKLSNNGFSKTGVSALAEALKFNNVITAIWLKGTKLTTEEKEAFEHVDRLFVKG